LISKALARLLTLVFWVRELDERLGLSTLIRQNIKDERRGKYTQVPISELL
jgi:hypothetical protein